MLSVKIKSLSILNSKEILLKDFNQSFEAGNIYSILGSNGSGKTTFFNVIADIYDPRFFKLDAEISYDDFKLDSNDQQSVQRFRHENIRYIFQDSINSFDPLKKLNYFFKKFEKHQSEIDSLLDFFELPIYEEIKKKHIYELSGGMAQRIQIIIALLAKPKFIFLDEPTSSLDYPIARLVSEKIKEFTKINNSICLIITQDARFALNCSDKIGILKDKEILEFKSASEVELDWIISQIS